MSKIVKLPTAKPITCACCGCVYEFESGDNVKVDFYEYASMATKFIILSRRLECPNCHYENDIEFEKENENVENKG